MTSVYQLAARVAAEKGKHHTCLNADRHGLTGQICLLTGEEHESFDPHCTSIRESLEPVGALELDLEQSIAEDHWRLKPARALETGIFALGRLGALATPDRDDSAQLPIDEALSQTGARLAKGKNLHLLALYIQHAQRIHWTTEKNMAQPGVRADREAARQPALEAQLLAQLAYSKGDGDGLASDLPPELLQIGSDFSGRWPKPPDRRESAPQRGPPRRRNPGPPHDQANGRPSFRLRNPRRRLNEKAEA